MCQTLYFCFLISAFILSIVIIAITFHTFHKFTTHQRMKPNNILIQLPLVNDPFSHQLSLPLPICPFLSLTPVHYPILLLQMLTSAVHRLGIFSLATISYCTYCHSELLDCDRLWTILPILPLLRLLTMYPV